MPDPLPLADAQRRLGRPGRPRKASAPAPASIAERAVRLLNLDAAAAYLSCSTWTVRDLEAAGVLKRVRVPLPNGELRKLLFDRQDLDQLIERWKDRA